MGSELCAELQGGGAECLLGSGWLVCLGLCLPMSGFPVEVLTTWLPPV